MGIGKIKVGKKGITYIPDVLRDDGYIGDVEYLANAKTVILIRPKATLKEVEKSLEILLQDVKLRRGGGE